MVKLVFFVFVVLLCFTCTPSDAHKKLGVKAKQPQNDSKSNAEMLPAANEGGTRGGSEQQQAEAAQQKQGQSNSENSAPHGPRVSAGNDVGDSSARDEQNRPGPIAAQPQKQGASNASSAPPTEAQSLGKQDEQPHVEKVEAGGTSPWTIVGSIFGGIGAAGIIVWIVISCFKRCRRTNKCTTEEEEEKPKSAEVPPESQQTTTTSSSSRSWGLRGFSYTSPEFPKNGLFPVFSMEMPTPNLQAGMGNGTHHQAEKGEHQAEKGEHQAEKREHQAEKREHQAEKREHQAEKGEHQAEKREHQAEKREHQGEKGERNEQPTAQVNAVPQQQQQAAQKQAPPNFR